VTSAFGVPREINDRGISGVGAIEMNADPKRKPRYDDLDRAKRARRHQEEVLDDALKNTSRFDIDIGRKERSRPSLVKRTLVHLIKAEDFPLQGAWEPRIVLALGNWPE
jgi:hypothetical protein